jgi:hypothetical protein
MTTEPTSTGATPDATGATPAAAGQTGSTGATLDVGKANGTGATPAPTGSADATSRSYPDGLGDAGKRALDSERDARVAAETQARDATKELEKLRKASQSEQEKALDEARGEGWTKAAGLVRRAEVRRALTAAGCRFVDLASKADEFANLEVTEDGTVKDLDKVIDRFKAATPAAFGEPAKPTDFGGGPRGGPAVGSDMNTAIRRAAGRA